MPLLTIRHVTHYQYSQPVSFGEHRIIIRPRESFDQRLITAKLEIDPAPRELSWLHDVLGNSIAIATFDRRAKRREVASEATLEHAPLAQRNVDVEPYARLFPFTCSSADMPDLLRSIERQYPDPSRIVDNWARGFVTNDGTTETVALLTDMANTIKRTFTYVPRHQKGTQTPIKTLAKRQGTCRDFATPMIEATRALGFAARFVSGYVYNPSRSEGRVGGGKPYAVKRCQRIVATRKSFRAIDWRRACIGRSNLSSYVTDRAGAMSLGTQHMRQRLIESN